METIIALDDLKEGMVLAEEIRNSVGQILKPAGATISANDKEILKKQKVESVIIKSSKEEDSLAMTDEIKKEAFKRLKKRLLWKARNENENDIIQIALISSAMKILKSGEEEN